MAHVLLISRINYPTKLSHNGTHMITGRSELLPVLMVILSS